MKRFNNFQKVPDLLQALLNICLFFLAIALSVLLISETWYIVQFVYKTLFNKGESYYGMLGELLIFFMYFEFIALIIKYFKSNFHFPLRYFIYIGITAVIRGGGYIEQPLTWHWRFLNKLTKQLNSTVYVPVYPKAPNYQYMDATESVRSIYQSLLEKGKPENIVIMGDYAGERSTFSFCPIFSKKRIPADR